MAETDTSITTGPAPKGRMPRPERERQIIARAETVFAMRGFEAASMEEIARASGVDRALVYQYFGSKRELYDSVHSAALNELTQSVMQALDGIADTDDEAARTELARRAVRAFFEFVQDHSDGWDVLFGAGWSTMGLTRRDDDAGPDMRAWVEGLLTISYPAAAPAERAASAAALLGAGWAISLWWRQSETMSIDEVTEHLLSFSMSALEPLTADS